ncbi:3-deoxy-D-manno-octulosonic acid transferase [Acidicapsa acidisoli]|uniref:3-deoxy-D-manno-octulosonic acid transferase n=1 Tax=Acidicapsa acidisoli TaxID=1615681 RepID=UPI0021E0E026|nr:3-deoxy-D-manno-octulosonic acid transferase [Acidicapsa acidisoli]
MILFLYNVGLLLALVVSAPWWLWRMATTRKYREGLRERLGGVPARIWERQLDAVGGASVSRPVIWIHAVSVGEVLAVTRLVAELDAELPQFRVMISTTTRTGQALARERFGAERVFYCPLDLPWAVRAYFKVLQPRMLVLAETEFWPNLLSCCFRRGIPVVVVNARISDRSWPRYQRLRSLWQPFLSRLAAVLAQSEVDAERLCVLGCVPDRVTVSGNLKFDVRVGDEAAATSLIRKLTGDLRLVVAGSTLEGEEAMLLAAWPELLDAEPNLAMVLAPRHPERFAAGAEVLERARFPWRRRSRIGERELASGEIVLLDSIGELASVYSLAAVAFVGGSLVPAGGHNPLEPAQFGVPVVMGEHYGNFRAIVEAMRAQDAMVIAPADELAEAISSVLGDTAAARALGDRGRRVFEEQAGATKRSVVVIKRLLGEEGAA